MNENQPPVAIIEAGQSIRHYWRDLWRYRELLFFLCWRDILVRYKQTVLGIVWSILKPLLTMVVFTLLFSRLAKLPAGNVPYPVMVFAALLPWQFIATAFTEVGMSLTGNANLISKVYFPRMIIPASAILVSLVDLLLASIVLLGLMSWYDFLPDWRLAALPLFMLLAAASALAAGLWVAALNVRFRDVANVIPFIIQFSLFASPVGFRSEVVPEHLRFLFSLNPLVGVIDGFRWALLRGSAPLYWPALLYSVLLVSVLLLAGIRYFRTTEKRFADII
ncbi:ABC transporter permease [Geobacter argillaceus]|uniref:Transport permease protein n=1 Tax=Geobacter argillaceus TaxID=345631 RepID=A0A562VNA0_9BACT|nr:ABC transporter permease [Geobacter argillaceus]TWJ19375.1 lipopolysaccharide transport system permease protein [Geobacter argillaceus]